MPRAEPFSVCTASRQPSRAGQRAAPALDLHAETAPAPRSAARDRRRSCDRNGRGRAPAWRRCRAAVLKAGLRTPARRTGARAPARSPPRRQPDQRRASRSRQATSLLRPWAIAANGAFEVTASNRAQPSGSRAPPLRSIERAPNSTISAQRAKQHHRKALAIDQQMRRRPERHAPQERMAGDAQHAVRGLGLAPAPAFSNPANVGPGVSSPANAERQPKQRPAHRPANAASPAAPTAPRSADRTDRRASRHRPDQPHQQRQRRQRKQPAIRPLADPATMVAPATRSRKPRHGSARTAPAPRKNRPIRVLPPCASRRTGRGRLIPLCPGARLSLRVISSVGRAADS